MQDKSVWFGTRDDMVQVKCPSTGLTRVPTSWRTNGTFLSGGGYARSSGTAHTDASISWGGDSVDDFATLLTQLNKDEPLHYLDPLSSKTNVLPPYAAQYTRNNPQGATEAAGVGGNGYPAKAAAYSRETLIGSAFVPEGYNLWIGAHGTGGLRVTTLSNSFNIIAISISSPVRVTDSFVGVGAFYDIYATAGSTLNGVIAQVLPADETPSTGVFVPGMGFSALRLKEDPQITEYSAVLGNYHMAMTANFTEVGSWES